MAKKKLNVKFLALVLGALGVGVAVLGLIVLVQFRNDPVRHVKRGDTLVAEAEATDDRDERRSLYDAARQQYVRAIGKKPGEMEYYDLAIDATTNIEPKSKSQSRDLYLFLGGLLTTKIEYARDKEIREAVTLQLLDNLDVLTYVVPRGAGSTNAIRAHQAVADRLETVDAKFGRFDDNELDPRLKATVRGLVVSPLWRGADLASNSEWRESIEEIEEAIALDPGYVPTQYGLLRGMLARLESEVNTAPDRTIRRSLEGEGGLNERIAAARDAVEGPAPELDLIEFERDQILLLVGKTGDGPDALGTAPDIGRLAAIANEIRELPNAGLGEYELRARIVELWWSIFEAVSRKPKGRVDPVLLASIGEVLAGEVFRAANDSLMALRPDGEIDLRSDHLVVLVAGSGGADQKTNMAYIDSVIENAKSVSRVSSNQFVADNVLKVALQKRFDMSLRRTTAARQLTDEDLEDLTEAYETIKDTYASDEDRNDDPRWQRIELLYKARLSTDAGAASETVANTDDARILRAESLRYATEATAAARAFEKQAGQIDPLSADAAMLVALKTGEVGTATRIFRSVASSRRGAEEDVGLQLKLGELLVLGGQFAEAGELVKRLRSTIETDDLARLEQLARIETLIEERGMGTSIDELPGVDLFNEARSAAIAGDLVERRRLLEDLTEKKGAAPKIRVLALLELAYLEEADGDYEEMKTYARRALEIDPDDIQAKILMNSDATTTTSDRMRAMAEEVYEDQLDIDVAQARTAAGVLGRPGTLTTEELAEIESNLRVLQERIRTADPKRPMALDYLFEMAVAERDYPAAVEYVDQLETMNGGRSPRTVAQRVELAMADEDLDGAIGLAEEAIDQDGFGSDGMRRLLGSLYEKRGDREEARRQYQEAFKQAPNRWRNALSYARALLADGEVVEALEALRAGRGTGRATPDFRDTWLFVEIQSGNFDTAIRERERLFAIDPFDTKNAIELARLLGDSPVGREAIVHAESNPRTGAVAGEPRFDTLAWGKLSRADRRQLQFEMREARLAEAREVFEVLLEKDPTSAEVIVGAIRFGQLHNEYKLGETDDIIETALARLREKIANESGGLKRRAEDQLSRVLAEKGRLAYGRGELELADASFDEALRIGMDGTDTAARTIPRVEALTAIVSMLSREQDIERASKYQRELLNRMEVADVDLRIRRSIAAQLAKMYVGTGQNEVAAEVAAGYFDEESANALELSILGTIAFGRADQIRKESGADTGGGLSPEVDLELDRANDLFEAALKLDARNPEALLQRAVLAEYRWLYASDAERSSLFEEAVRAAREFVDNDQTLWAARLRLVRLILREKDLLDQGPIYQKAIAELREHLELLPDTTQARTMLIQLLDQSGRRVDAIDLAQASLERDSTNREWALALGNLRRSNKEFAEAAQLYGLLYEKTKQIGFLKLQVRSLLDWDAEDESGAGSASVIALVGENPRAFSGDPTLIGAYCVALVEGGRRAAGLKNFESSYKQLEAANKGRPNGERNRAMLSYWLPNLFPSTPEGTADLMAYVEQISGGNPTAADLLAVAGRWSEPDIDDIDSAISTVRRAIATDSDESGQARALQQLGILLTKSGDCDGAFGAFEQALELMKDDPQLLNNVAFLAAKCGGDLDLALERATRAVEALKYRAEFRDTLGAVHLARAREESDPERKRKGYRLARQELGIGAKLWDSASPLLQLAELELELDNSDEARKYLRLASDRLPDVPEADVQARIDELLAELKER
ncbi:MAG: hypothetical protein GY895_07860 [Phycisphaera sp.]|nr:hypothetical protein [Phycisphaera sp.]